MSSSQLSAALDEMFKRPEWLYGECSDIPVISQEGHNRRVELLDRLSVGSLSGMACVDFGMGSCGFGSAFPKMHDCARAIGMDISNVAISMSRDFVWNTQPKYMDHFETHQSDGMHLPLRAESVDLFFSDESIEHVKFPPRYISEVYRILRKGGQLVLTTPNRDAIRYKEKGEEYCTSSVHFWLFNTNELIEVLSRFFDIEEIYGFNASFGSREEDREITNRQVARLWSQQFEHEPDKATCVVLRAVKKPDVPICYEVYNISSPDIIVTDAGTFLTLDFGLKGLLLDSPNALVQINRPPSNGVVCRFWSHLWSGEAKITDCDSTDRLDLYSKVPGWRNWVSALPTTSLTKITISAAARKNSKAQSDQVIFFEAFIWRTLRRDGRPCSID